eukprot:886543-Amphidinium_carterae.1
MLSFVQPTTKGGRAWVEPPSTVVKDGVGTGTWPGTPRAGKGAAPGRPQRQSCLLYTSPSPRDRG